MDLQLKSKRALVSGSHRGTGRAIAHALAREGAHVLVHGFELDAAEAVAAEIRKKGFAASAVAGDIMTDKGAAGVVEAAGDIDILINNYGTADPGSWERTEIDGWIDAYQKNVLSAVRLTRGLMGAMKAKGWGRIVMLGTIGSTEPAARMPHYYASKGAL
ncbi:MAG: SDR family NAD(P)-dependent oxidoreductase, partial [Parvibaculum sp.]